MGKFKIITQDVSIDLFIIVYSVFIWAGAKKNSVFRFILPGIEMILNQSHVKNNFISDFQRVSL